MGEGLYKELSFEVIGAAMEVHRHLGSGFLEAVYQKALAHELKLRGIVFVEQPELEIHYKGELVGQYRADFVVDDRIILELKSISCLNAGHTAQALNCFAATGLRLALLLNFGEPALKVKRIIR